MATIEKSTLQNGWQFSRSGVYVDSSHSTYHIALVNEGAFIDLRYKEKTPPAMPIIIVRFFPRTRGFEKGTEDSRLIDIGEKWLTLVDQRNEWRSICVNVGIEPFDLGSLIEELTTCAHKFIESVDSGRIRRRIEDRLRKEPELVRAIALIMGIS